MQTFFYSILHFLTDGLCALALYSRFSGSARWAALVLLYDFCAFVLQMPFGAVLDLLKMKLPEKAAKLPFLCALCGAALTVLGAFTHPLVLGLGNALFHVGGGIGTIAEDRKRKRGGAALGIFVAPGAMGLYLGTVLGQSGGSAPGFVLPATAAVYLLLFAVFGLISQKMEAEERKKDAEEKAVVPETGTVHDSGNVPDTGSAPDSGSAPAPATAPAASGLPRGTAPAAAAAALCFIVVVLRSYAGFSVAFSWKQGFSWGFVCTLAVVLGKMAGGILAARFGAVRVMTVSLLLAAAGYCFSDLPAAGIAALFFFNMTMPVTLYMIADRFRGLEGFSFGLLTVALFLGVLPSASGAPPVLPGHLAGAAVSLLSLLLLLLSARLLEREKTWRS